jgi:hypothetical protein
MNSNDRNLPQNETEAATPSTSTDKPAGSSSLWRTIGKVAMWVVLTPIALLILLSILIYLPPVQRWAVNEASEWLSEETGMEVSVGSVSLKPFLDLEMGDMLAVARDTTENGVVTTDTVVDARSLGLSVRFWPLFKGQVEVDKVELEQAKVNTRDLIDAALIKGEIGHVSLDAHSVDLNEGLARISNVRLRDADLYVALADSVPEDKTETEPVLWKVALENVEADNVRARVLLAPQADSVMVGANLGHAHLTGMLDLGEEIYNFKDIELTESAVTYDILSQPRVPEGFDMNHVNLTDVNVSIPNVRYAGTGDMQVSIEELQAREQSGLNINHAEGEIVMDSTHLDVQHLALETDESDLTLAYKMDMNAFDEADPGQFEANVEGHIGKGDLARFAAPYMQDVFRPRQSATDGLHRALPAWPVGVKANVSGNLQRLRLNNVAADIPGYLTMRADGVVENLNDTTGQSMLADVNYDAHLQNVNFVKGFMPAEARNSFNLPPNMKVSGNARMQGQQLATNTTLNVGGSTVRLGAGLGMNDETYDIDMDLKDFNVNQFVPLEEPTRLTGHVTAKGRGFDFLSPRTVSDAKLNLTQAHMGKMNFGNSDAVLHLKNGNLDCNLTCDNEQLQTHAAVSGKVQTQALDAHLNLNLALADLQAMGLSETPLEVQTNGIMDVYSDLGDNFRIDADINRMSVLLGTDRIDTESFDMYAETTRDTTNATVRTGDLYFDFHAPQNLFRLLERFERIGIVAQKQINKRALDVNQLKSYLPVTSLKAHAGTQNPVSKLLGLYGISFGELHANVITNPDQGLVGDAHIYRLRADTISVDTVFFDVQQDSTQFTFRSGVTCDDQKLFPGFSAHLDGYASTQDADARLTFFNKQREQGIDLGLHATITDSTLNGRLYPEQPILGYRKFALNDDNFIRLGKKNRMWANVHLTSLEDSCRVSVTANPADSLLQDIRAVINNLDLAQLLAVIPGAPKMTGMLNLDANYEQNTDRFWVSGSTGIRRFTYEGTPVGDVGAVFDYAPVSTTEHGVLATLLHNDRKVAIVNGKYKDEGNGFLDAKINLTDLPLSMIAPFIPDQIVTFDGTIDGELTAQGPIDKLDVNGEIQPDGMRMKSELYSLDMRFADAPFRINNSRIIFDKYEMYGTGAQPLTLNGWVDFADTDNIQLNLSLYGREFELMNAPRTRKAVVFGKMFGNFFVRMNGTLDDLHIRGLIRVLSQTDLTYVMADTPLSVDYRLEDIVTFVDFNQPPDPDAEREKRTFMGMDMQVNLTVEDGAQFHCEFSADRQSYVNVQGGGSLVLNSTPEGVMSLLGRYTINEGEMKYTLPVIPLKTFNIHNGSYVEFTGDPMNPTINFAASERTKATVSDAGGGSRSVTFNAGLKVTGTLEDMQLLFTIEAPEDLAVQNELAAMSTEEKNKLAVGLLCTGMYMSASNSSSISANNALNNFLQNEINNIAGQAFASAVDVNVGMEQSMRDDGTTRTDYAFKFSKRFFSNRLNVIVGGRVNADGSTQANESGAYIDNVSLEYRLDNSGTRYVRLYHEKNYDNLIEGELTENGASIVLRKKLDKLSDLLIWKRR